MMNLQSFQLTVAKVLTALAVVHVPILAAICAALGRGVLANTVACAALALIPLILFYAGRPIVTVAFGLAIALVGQTSLLVLAFEGHPWQVEMHFYYFAVLAMLSGFCDWRVLALGAGLVAVHHASLNFILPAALYPSGGNILRVAVHAVIVVIEVAMLVFIGEAIRRAFAMAEEARNTAEKAVAELKDVGDRREQDLATSNKRVAAVGQLLENFKAEMAASINVLNDSADKLERSADGLGVTADRTRVQMTTALSASTETTAQVMTVANTGKELAKTISEISGTVARSSRLTNDSVGLARAANQTISELTTAANEIGDMTGLISRIAAQTNLLALNATIEAARAGAAGKGFAIVAQEVKVLAAETAKATDDIAKKTAGIQGTTERSAAAIEAIVGMIGELDVYSARIAGAIEQQASATREIAQNVDAAAIGVGEVGASMSDIAAMADQTARATTDFRHAAVELAAQTNAIRARIMGFADDIRAAQA
jgi:methyl-accepting chemotaxis protein